MDKNSSKKVATWLFIGVGMLIVQIVLGGITRLTQSGLSITEWNPITGVIPPLNTHQWMAEFDKYKNTDQFRYLNSGFTLSDFKYIFFWEWFHRLWARLMGVVFLAGFFYFLPNGRPKEGAKTEKRWTFAYGKVAMPRAVHEITRKMGSDSVDLEMR